MPERALILDTHVWLWAVNGDPNIQPSIRRRIALALVKSRVLVPVISVWEVGMLWKKNRIQLKEPLREWVRSGLQRSGFSLAPLTEEIAVESSLLPGSFHNDPADAMIVATARVERALLFTRDSRMIEYGKAGHVDVLGI
jgi:PIN domain nuclease of toxin-antitoxin system